MVNTSILFSLAFIGIVSYVQGSPCLTTGSKKDFDNTRDALNGLKSHLSKTASIIQTQINSINGKVNLLNKDINAMEADLKRNQWLKYNGHCYHFGKEFVIWSIAQGRCTKIGGYLAKVDDANENAWIFQEMKKAKRNYWFWLGMTDVYNGEFRWLYDGTKLKYTNWMSGHPYAASHSYSTNNNCVISNPASGKWKEYVCNAKTSYVCESDICFS